MTTDDCTTYHEWLDLEAEGALGPAETAALARHLDPDQGDCAACREERRAIAALHRELAASRLPVPEGFAERVMAALPAAGWEARHPRAWKLPVAALALLAGAAAALAGISSAELHPGMPFVAAASAVADLFVTAALAGAGLLAASWSGIGLVLGELFSSSTGTLVAFAVLVVGVNLLLFFLLRRRPAAARASAERGSGSRQRPAGR